MVTMATYEELLHDIHDNLHIFMKVNQFIFSLFLQVVHERPHGNSEGRESHVGDMAVWYDFNFQYRTV